MGRLANTRAGRVLLHLLALFGDRALSFHFSGIARELTPQQADELAAGESWLVVLLTLFAVACYGSLIGV